MRGIIQTIGTMMMVRVSVTPFRPAISISNSYHYHDFNQSD